MFSYRHTYIFCATPVPTSVVDPRGPWCFLCRQGCFLSHACHTTQLFWHQQPYIIGVVGTPTQPPSQYPEHSLIRWGILGIEAHPSCELWCALEFAKDSYILSISCFITCHIYMPCYYLLCSHICSFSHLFDIFVISLSDKKTACF